MRTLLAAAALLILPALCGQQQEFEELGSRSAAAAQAGRYEEAVAGYRRMLEIDPANEAVRFDLALALNRLGRSRESLAVLGTPVDADALALAGANLRFLGQPAVAASMLRKAFALAPSPAIAYDLGLTLLDLDQPAEAQQVLAKFPEDSLCQVGLGLVAFAAGRHADAEALLAKAAAGRPRDADVQASLGDLRFAGSRFDEALAAYTAANHRDPASASHLVKAARALSRLDRETEAAENYRKALRLDPLQPEANTALARIVSAQGDRATARRLLETAIAAEPAKSNAYYQLLLLCRAQQDEACTEFARRRFEQLRAQSSLRVEMSPPSVILEGPPGERRWGRYQFPAMHRMADGRLIVFVHVNEDSATAYGAPKKTFVSSDDGYSWREDRAAANGPYGFRLPNGEWLRIETPPALDAATLELPESVGSFTSYRVDYTLYRIRDLARELRLIFLQRFAGGKWSEQSSEIDDPGGLRYVVEGRFPRIWWGDLRAAKDGSLLTVAYPSIAPGPPFRFGSAAWRSQDQGRTWKLRARIRYQPDPKADPKAEARGGFTEPAIEVLADGSLYSVLRTTDGNGIGPMYDVRSRDLGRTWSQPAVLAPNGVLPRLLRLDNGILVLASGRPGVQLRFSEKGTGEDWSEPWDLLPFDPTNPHADSCGYSDLVALDADSFLFVYSWFQKPDADGKPRKSILARRIRVVRSAADSTARE